MPPEPPPGTLPLAAEIREARRQVQEAQDAEAHLRSIDTLVTSLRVVEGLAARRPDAEAEVPGDDLLAMLRARWPQLRQVEEPPADTLLERARGRRLLLESAAALLRPAQRESTTRHEALHRLQEAQLHRVQEAPEHAALVRKVKEIQGARAVAEADLRRLDAEVQLLEPLRRLLEQVATRVDDHVAQPHPQEGVTLQIVNGHLEALQVFLDAHRFDFPMPGAATTPADLPAIAERLREILSTLATEEPARRARRDALKARCDALAEEAMEIAG